MSHLSLISRSFSIAMALATSAVAVEATAKNTHYITATDVTTQRDKPTFPTFSELFACLKVNNGVGKKTKLPDETSGAGLDGTIEGSVGCYTQTEQIAPNVNIITCAFTFP